MSGVDPTTFTVSDPLRLWIIQMGEPSYLLFQVRLQHYSEQA